MPSTNATRSHAGAPGEIPSWAGTEVRDAAGAVVGHVAALRFDPLTAAPSQLVVSLADGTAAVLPAGGLRVRLDHVALAPGVGAPAVPGASRAALAA